MIKRICNKVIAFILSGTLLITMSASSFASSTPISSTPVSSALQGQLKTLQDIQQKQDTAISILNQYVKVAKDGTLQLNAPKSIVNSIDTVTYNNLVTSLNHTNDLIKSGDLKVGTNLKLTASSNLQQSLVQTAVSSGNYNGSDFYWWGFYLYMDSTACTKLVVSYSACNAVVSAWLNKYVPSSLAKGICNVVLGAVWGAATLVAYYNSACRGVVMRFNFAPIPVFTGMWSQ